MVLSLIERKLDDLLECFASSLDRGAEKVRVRESDGPFEAAFFAGYAAGLEAAGASLRYSREEVAA